MTTNPLDEIAARADAATEGPWVEFHENGEPGELEAFHCPPATGAFLIKYGADRGQQQRDANFMAHARTDVPRLVEALRGVEFLHRDGDGECLECSLDCGCCNAPWPCATIRAIREALG